MKPSFAIAGCGKVGTALGKVLISQGYRLTGLSCKNASSAQKAARILGTNHFSTVAWEITEHSDIVFISTPDSVIQETCFNIAQHKGFSQNTVVLHCSGALPSTILSAAKTCGAFTGSMHPLQSFADSKTDGNPFAGIVVSVEGDEKAVNTAREIVKDLGADFAGIKTESKILYHAAAVAASNYLVTLLDLAFNLIEEAGIARKDAFKILKPLVEGTLDNIEKAGIPAALTGPIARGDIETVTRHLDEIGQKKPELLSLYRTLGLHTIDIALSGKTISESTAKNLKKILLEN
ncbi:MAG: DUF2520 domain-containing protein [Deltaproteobacteria bacterium]|nr:DUF2520 domain-containing protein [Deltaproteobacteria bacterium]